MWEGMSGNAGLLANCGVDGVLNRKAIRNAEMPRYIRFMAKQEREWEIIRLRERGEWLGTVKATDEAAAVKAALKVFALDKSEAERLLVRPRLR